MTDEETQPQIEGTYIVQVEPLCTLNGSVYQGDTAVLLDNGNLYGLPRELSIALSLAANPDPMLEAAPATTGYDAVVAATAGQENEDTGGREE